MVITELFQVPEHLPVIAAWIHQAFWQGSGQPVGYVEKLLEDHTHAKSIPLTLVAMDASTPVGSVCLVENDMAERPNLSPWLAALYVVPTHRKRGIGSQLVNTVVKRARQARCRTVFLNADEQVDFYASLGWQPIEENVGPLKLTIMKINCEEQGYET
jgi:predicted N-acetyltransferase YhbS